MGVAIAIASIVGAGVSLYGTAKNAKIQKKQLALQEREMRLNAKEKMDQYGIEIDAANSQINSYDKWLAEGQYYEHGAQTKQLMSEGQQAYENFINAIGYSDAVAGATGRIGAGTSTSEATKYLDQKLVDYFGENRTLDENGGLFGSQLSWLNYQQAIEKEEAQANRNILDKSVANYQNARDNIYKEYVLSEIESQKKAYNKKIMRAKGMGKNKLVDKYKNKYNQKVNEIKDYWGF